MNSLTTLLNSLTTLYRVTNDSIKLLMNSNSKSRMKNIIYSTPTCNIH